MQAPTDNLYKFMAISGLLCFVFFFFDLNRRLDELNATLDTWAMQQAEFSAQREAVNDSVEYMAGKARVLKEEKPSRKQKEAMLKELGSFQDELQVKFESQKIINAKLNKGIELAKNKLEDIKHISKLYNCLKIFSLVVAGLGIFLWYIKTQKYLDIKDRAP